MSRLAFRAAAAILAHELAHLEGNDGFAIAMADGIDRSLVGSATVAALPALLALSGLAAASAWIRGRPDDRSGPFSRLHRALAGALFAGFVLATLVSRSRSRKREFAADDRAAEVTGDPIALARALRQIERATEPLWSFAPFSTHKRTDEAAERWLSTHPSTDERVERLREMAESQGPTQRIPGGRRGRPSGEEGLGGDGGHDARFGRNCGGACRRAPVGRESHARGTPRAKRAARLGRSEVRSPCVPASEASGRTEVVARAAQRAGTSSGGAGLKGAVARTKHDDGSTTASGASEARGSRRRRRLVITKGAPHLSNDSESRESSRLGLWRCSSSRRQQPFITGGWDFGGGRR